MNRRVPAALLAAALVVAGCTGVPISSTPEIVQPLNGEQPTGDSVPPPPRGADQREIVTLFQQDNAAADANHNGARAFMTAQARNRWQDQTGATIIDTARVGNVGTHENVVVKGNEIGSLQADGEFTPALQGDGTGSGAGVQQVSRRFQLAQVDGQWRINSLTPGNPGLLLTRQEFDDQYQQRTLYFYDTTETRLVPDIRWTPAYSPQVLADWLTAQLVAGPRPALQDAETNEFPAQTEHVTVQLGRQTARGLQPTRVDIPGASQLAAANKRRLAIELVATLQAVPGVQDMEITDGGAPVQIPELGSATFNAVSLGNPTEEPPPAGAPYYIDTDHQVVDAQGQPLPGRLGQYGLVSIALADRSSPHGLVGLLAAGVHGSAPHQYVDIGTAAKLSTVRLPGGEQLGAGPFSRPDWAPRLKEVWIGDGTQLLRIGETGTVGVVPIESASKITGQVLAVRFSPDGTRVALVIRSAPSSQSAYVGTVVRPASGAVRVENLQQVSPDEISAQDVGWELDDRLYVIGRDIETDEPDLYSVGPDGAEWRTYLDVVGLLPGAPDSLAVGEGALPVVSTRPTLWQQSNDSWAPLHGEETRGTSPTYVN